MLSVTSARDDERPFWGSRHRMPQRAPMAWPNRRCAHCHLPPRALPDAQPQHHGAQCAEQHDKTTWRTTNISHHQAPVVRPARARSISKCHTLRTRLYPIANRLAPSQMLCLLLHSSPTSFCTLLHNNLQATCPGSLAPSWTLDFDAYWNAQSTCSRRHCTCHATTPQPLHGDRQCE